MVLESAVSATQAEYEARRSQFLRQSFVYAAVSIVTDACCAVLAFITRPRAVRRHRRSAGSSGAIFMTLMTLPVTGLIAVHALQQEKVLDGLTARREAALRDAVERADLESTRGQRQGQHQEFEARLLNALEMAENETEVLGVVQDAFSVTLPERSGRVAPRRQQPRPPRAGRDRRTRRPGAGLPGGVAEPVPGGAAGADPAVPRQRRARRVPEAAEPPERRVRRGLRARLDHGPHGRRHPRDRPGGLDRRRRRHRRPADARQAGGHAARPAAHHGRDPAPGRDRRAHRALEPPHDGEPRSMRCAAGASRSRWR